MPWVWFPVQPYGCVLGPQGPTDGSSSCKAAELPKIPRSRETVPFLARYKVFPNTMLCAPDGPTIQVMLSLRVNCPYRFKAYLRKLMLWLRWEYGAILLPVIDALHSTQAVQYMCNHHVEGSLEHPVPLEESPQEICHDVILPRLCVYWSAERVPSLVPPIRTLLF